MKTVARDSLRSSNDTVNARGESRPILRCLESGSVDGSENQLRTRLVADDAFGAIDCFFGSMSDSDIDDLCRTRCIDRRPELLRQELFEKLQHRPSLGTSSPGNIQEASEI